MLYTVLLAIFFNLPSLTLRTSIKSVSFKSVNNFLVNVKDILNLSAPGAA